MIVAILVLAFLMVLAGWQFGSIAALIIGFFSVVFGCLFWAMTGKER